MMIEDILFYATAYISLFISIFWFTTYFISDKTEKRKKLSHYPSLSIIIPAYNEEKNIENCIRLLLKQDYPDLKIIVVDDGSTDNTCNISKRLSREFANLTYIKKKNRGKAAALNTGLKIIDTELFGFIDADTHLSDNTLKNMVRYIHGNVVSTIAFIKPHTTKSAIERIQRIEYMLSSFTRKLMCSLKSLYYTPGFAIYKTDVVKELGGFDENNITEDLEIGLRLKNAGYDIENSAEDSAFTIVPKSFKTLFWQRMRWYRGYIYNTKKYSHMFFNRKFGDMGIFVLPIQYILLALIVPMLIFSIYNTVATAIKRIIDIYLIGPDVGYFMNYGMNIITPTTFFFLAVVVAFVLMIILSAKKVKEKISVLDGIIYIIIYPFINLVLWVAAFVYEATRSERKWTKSK